MSEGTGSVIENGNAAIVAKGRSNVVVFESGNAYKIYGPKNENKVKLIGKQEAPDFERWDEYHFQHKYRYLGIAQIVKTNRTLKLLLN